MGCWNATCGISGLPIHYNDPVIGLIIKQEMADNRPSYAWTSWVPATVLVRGQYDDYGSIELNEGELDRLKWSERDAASAMREIVIKDASQNATNQKNTTYGYVDIGPFNDGTENDNLGDQPDGFSLWMVHAGLFDRLANETKVEYYDGKSFGNRSIRDCVDLEIAKRRAESSEFISAWGRDGSDFKGPAVSALARLLMKDKATDDALLSAWGDLYALCQLMSALRLSLNPTSGWGSQDSNYQAHKALAAAKQEIITNQLTKWGNEDEDED